MRPQFLIYLYDLNFYGFFFHEAPALSASLEHKLSLNVIIKGSSVSRTPSTCSRL